MQHPAYEDLVHFASDGHYASELQQARAEFIERTGDLFESDHDFESRIGSFLEWYSLDRMVSHASNATPARLYIEHVTPQLTTPEIQALRPLTRTRLSLFDVKRVTPKAIKLYCLLTTHKHEARLEAPLLGVESGDILEGRLLPDGDNLGLSHTILMYPKSVRKLVLKRARAYRKDPQGQTRIDMVQRMAFLRNRATRYAHVDPRQIFTDAP
ncbi:MAG: hypothetical protein VX699_11755 [Myxococcota bacterium]|nr:hypothetical protein [Myxococcota bacterium]